MIETNIPKYAAIKSGIVQNINNRVYKPGQLLPSERELIEMYQVSRITVRKALAELENEGYLYKVQGKGTFVKDEQNRQNLFSLTSCTQDIIRLGMTPSRRVVFSGMTSADKTLQEALELKEADPVFTLHRVYCADDEPVNYTETHVPGKFVPQIDHFDFGRASLYDVLENKYKITITRSVRTVEAVIPDADVCERLSVSKGMPLLLFRCKTYGRVNGKEAPIEYFKCYYRSDHFSFFINQVRQP